MVGGRTGAFGMVPDCKTTRALDSWVGKSKMNIIILYKNDKRVWAINSTGCERSRKKTNLLFADYTESIKSTRSHKLLCIIHDNIFL